MSLRTALKPSFWVCNSCQSSLLLRALAAVSRTQLPPIRRQHARRGLSTNTVHRSEQLLSAFEKDIPNHLSASQDIDFGENDAAWEDLTGPQSSPPPSTAESADYIPWYLRVQPKKPLPSKDHPLAEKQRIPDLPEDPPPILPTLLEQLSVNIGLDYLTLLDLRSLDPPAALGSNLIMLLGTARSEKHLHVSADRFCRYLRSEHNLAPYADGLLGRNEMKLKMRRKNRRAKLMANVGAPVAENVDDGIRTGWVCVLAGQVDPSPNAVRQKPEPVEGFVGFGQESEKVTIVIQMFTEEKRVETDLEALWRRLLERSKMKQGLSEDMVKEADALERRREAGENVDEDENTEDRKLDALDAHFQEMDVQESRIESRT